MTLYTSPDGLPVPEDTDPVAPLNETLEDISVGTQAALLRPGAVGSAAARNAAIPNPVSGQSVWRTDQNWREMYFSSGVKTAGWFPTDGLTPFAYYTRAAAFNWTTNTAVAFDTLADGAVKGFTYSAGTFTIQQAGLWEFYGSVGITNVSSDVYANAGWYRNGAALTGHGGSSRSMAFTNHTVRFTGTCAVGDALNLRMIIGAQQTGVTQDGTRALTFATVRYLGPA